MSALSDALSKNMNYVRSGNGTRSTEYDGVINNPQFQAWIDAREKISNAKNEMWGDSGILGNIERLRDTFVNTTGSMLRGANISDFTNEWGKEMQDNASLRMANLPETVSLPHGQGVGAWLSYLSDIDRGALPQVTNVFGSATAMLAPTAISMIPIGRGASLAAKGLSKVPAIARGLENSKGIQQILKDITMGGVSAQYESLAEKGDTIRTLEEMGLPHEEAVRRAEAVQQENQGLLTATNMAESALANPILRKIFPAFNAVGDDIVTGAKTAANLSARASAIRNAINRVPKPIIEGAKIGGSMGANTLMNGYEEGVQNQIQEAHTPTVDENGNFVFKNYDVNDLINPSRWSEESWRAAEEGAVGASGLSLFGHGAGAVRNRLFNRPNTDVDTIDIPQSDNGIPLYNDQHYIITDQVSNPNATEDTLARLNALAHDYEEQFGEKLMVTSLRRDGNGDSWHDSGQAIDIAGGGLETNENGEREWLLKRGEELGLTGLDEYAHPSDHASGGHIHFSNHNDGGEVDNTASDFDTFMAKVGMQESGGNYDAVNSDSGASGKYQIMPENWSAWAEEAGLDPNSEMTPENQEKVARFKLKQYYDKYGDKGALVAWYAGEANAERYVNGLETDIWGREWTAPQDNAPSIQSYVDQALSRNVGGKSSKGGKTSGGTQIKDTPLEDYLKLFDDGKTENKTYDDYVKLIGNATDEQVMDNAEKAKEEATNNCDVATYTALDDMISNGDVEGLRNLAIQQAQGLAETQAPVNVDSVDNTVDTNTVQPFDFSEAIDGLRKIAQSGTPEQQQIAQNALSSNAPMIMQNAYNRLRGGALSEADTARMNTVLNSPALPNQYKTELAGMYNSGNFNGVRNMLAQIPDSVQSQADMNIMTPEQMEADRARREQTNADLEANQQAMAEQQARQEVGQRANAIAQQQANNLYSNVPLTAQEQATANSVLNSANGVFSDNIKNELFNALRNGDNASVRRVINGVPNNIPSQADVNQQAMAEKQKAMDNARLNVNRAMRENYDAFMETLDENEQEFMNFLDEVFSETGKGFKDILDSARNELVLLQQGLADATNQEDVAWVNERIGGLQNAIEGLESIAGKAYEFEKRRNELSRQGENGRGQSGRNIQQKEITNDILEIAKAYGVQLKGRLLDNNVPINEKAVDKSLNSKNQKEVDHVVERMENIAEKNNVDIEDIKHEAEQEKSISEQLKDAKAEKEEMLKPQLDYIEQTSGNKPSIVPLNDGSRRGMRASNNAQWYSEWYKANPQKHGKMSKKDKLEVAEKMYRGEIKTDNFTVSPEEKEAYEESLRQANAEMDAINAKIEALEKAKEKSKNAKAKNSPNKGTSSNAKKESAKNTPSKKSDIAKTTTTEQKNTPKTTLSEQESQEGVASEPQRETPSEENKPALKRKSESQKSEEKPKTTTEDNSKVKMVKESEETVSKAEIVGEKIRDDFMSKEMKDTVSTFLPVIRQKLNQFFLSAKPHKDKKRDSIYGGRTIEEVKNKMERLAKSIVNLVDTLSDFTADEKQVMKEVLQSRCKTAIDKAVKQIKDSNTKLAIDTSPEGIQEQAKINREKQLELVKTEFPTATNIVQDDDSIRFNLNDEKVRVDYVDRVIATEERKQAYRRDYGKEYNDDVSFLGDTQTIDGEQVITLLNRIGYEDTLSHEAFHLAFRTALTKAQQKILLDKYGDEEAVAEAYRELMNKSNARGTMFDMTSSIGRLFQKIWNFANSLFNVFNNGCMLHDAESIMYAIADGSIYELNEKNEKGIVAFLHPALLAVWHGTPHLFDSFSTDFIGEGEGVQAHGWGLYFALNKSVADGYKQRLSKIYKVSRNMEDEILDTIQKFSNEMESASEQRQEELSERIDLLNAYIENINMGKKEIISLAKESGVSSKNVAWFKKYLDELGAEKSYLYQVDIPSTDTMLREDKPFSEQPKQVQDALEKMWKDYKDSNTYSYKQNDDKYDVYRGDELLDTYDDEELAKQAVDENTNSTHIKKLSNFTNGREILSYVRKNLYYFTHDYKSPSSDKGASLWLNKYGIEGISYHGGQDGECCVVFNDKAVKILERNGEPVSDNNTKLMAVESDSLSDKGSEVKENKKTVDKYDRLKDNEIKISDSYKDSIFKTVKENLLNAIADMKKKNISDAEINNILTEENSDVMRKVVRKFASLTEWFNRDKIDSEAKENAVRYVLTDNGKNQVDFTGHDFNKLYEQLGEIYQRGLNYGRFCYQEFCTYREHGGEISTGISGWRELEEFNSDRKAEDKGRRLKAKKNPSEKSEGFSNGNKNSRSVPNPNSAESLKKNGDTETRLDKLPKVDYTKLNKTEKDIMKFGKALGVPVHFVTHYDPNYRGVFTHNGEIFINRKATVPAKDIFVHEFVHWLKASGNEAIFDSLSACLENINGVSHAKRLSEYRKYVYNGERMTNDEIIEEIICDAISYTATANKMFNAMNGINPTMAERTLGYFKTVWDKFCDAVGYKQNKPVGQQKLSNYLNASELAKVNAVLNQQLANLKDADGKAVFVFKNGKWTTAKSGKELSAEFNSKPVGDTVPKKKTNTDVANNIQKQPSNPTEETASSDTEGMFKKATADLLKKMGFKVDADKNVDVVRKSDNPNDINVLNRVFNSPSFIGRYNKLLAPFVSMAKSAVEKQEKLRYDFRNSLNEVEKILGYKTFKNDSNYKENKDNLNKIMILGDTEGKEYNAAELKKMGYNEQVIKAYLKMRKTLNDAWEMLNDITSRIKFGTSNLTEGELVDLKKNNPFLEVTSVSSEEDKNGRKRYTYKYPSVTTITEHLSKEDIDNLKKNEDVKIISSTQINNNEYIVKYAQRRRMGKIKGYVPHMFHEWSVVEVDKDGKILQDENGNSKFIRTFNNMNEAVKFANGLDKKGNYRVMPKLHEVMGASERSMIVQDYNYLKIMDKVVEDFTLTPEEAVELMNSDIKTGNRGRFLGNLMKRKGVKGYEEDMMYATYQYLNQVGRYVALDPFKRLAYSLYEKQFGKWGDEKVYNGELGQSAKWAKTYINAINGVPTDVEKNLNNALHALGIGREVAGGRPAIWLAHAMTYPMTIAKLGVLNVSSALLNITQLANLFGAMGDMSKDNLLRVANNAIRMYWQAWKNPDSQTGKLLWKDLGLRYQLGMDVAGGYSKSEVDGVASMQGALSKLAGKSMFMFRGTDSFGRGVTLLTAYQKARDEGKTHVEAVRYAKMINDRVNFDYSVADANGIYNQLSVIATVAFQFQKYPMKQIELFYDIFKEQRLLNKDKSFTNTRALVALGKYMMPYMALSGIAGVPFINLISALLGFASDDDRDLVEKIRAYLRENYGEEYPTLVNMASYGLLGGIGINTGSRIGIGDFLAGNANIKKTKIEIAVETFFGTLASTAMQTYKQLQNGNYVEALKAINPSVGNVATAYKGEVRTTRGRLKYTYADNYERFIRALGFTPVGETIASEQASDDYFKRQEEQAEKNSAIDEFIAHPPADNAKKLNELGITPKSIQTELERRNKNRHDINVEKEKKKEEKAKTQKKPKTYSASDYLQGIKK